MQNHHSIKRCVLLCALLLSLSEVKAGEIDCAVITATIGMADYRLKDDTEGFYEYYDILHTLGQEVAVNAMRQINTFALRTLVRQAEGKQSAFNQGLAAGLLAGGLIGICAEGLFQYLKK